jgi:class 3 adenylate cyclase
VDLMQQHHDLIRKTLAEFRAAEEIEVAGDSFFIVFSTPSDGVRCALLLQQRLRQFNTGREFSVEDRIGLHMGEVLMSKRAGKRGLHGIQVDTCARVMSLAQAGQILMTRPVFDNARQSLKGEEVAGADSLAWLNHGHFELKGVDEPIEICEVRAGEAQGLSPPKTTEKAHRVEGPGQEAVLGWRPAVGQFVPKTQWVSSASSAKGVLEKYGSVATKS